MSRKRESEEVNSEPVKRSRSARSTPVGAVSRRSLRNIGNEKTRTQMMGRESRVVNGTGIHHDEPSETEEEEEERIEDVGVANGKGAEGDWGEEDAEGEDDEGFVA